MTPPFVLEPTLHLETTSPVHAPPQYADADTTGGRAPASFELSHRMLRALLPQCVGSGFLPPSGAVWVMTVSTRSLGSGVDVGGRGVAVPGSIVPVLPADRLATVERWLSLSVTHLARVLGVGRQAIYRWRDNAPLRPENARRLADLCEVAERWADLAGVPLGSQVVTPLFARESLVDLLAAPDWDRGAIENVMRQLVPVARAEHEVLVNNPVEQLAARMDALGARAPTQAERAVNRAVQLRRGGRRR